jgi:hypothetical protein
MKRRIKLFAIITAMVSIFLVMGSYGITADTPEPQPA